MIQEGPKTDKQKLYDALSGEYDLGTYEEFERNIGDSVKRKKLFDAASADYDLGDYDNYSKRIGPTHKESLDAFNAEFGSFLNDFEERDTAETKMSRAGMSSGIIVPMEGSITGEERQRYQELHKQEEALKKAWYTSDEYLAQKDAEAFQLDQMRKDIDSGRLAYAQAHPMVEGYNPSATRGAEADKELSMYETASRIMDDTIKLHNAPSRYDGANAWQNVRKFARGAGDTFSDVDFWTMGLTEIADNFGVREVLATVQDKLGNLNDLSEESIENILTPAEKAVLQAWAINAQEQLSRQGDLSRGYQAGQGAAESLGFMAEFMLTGGIGKAASEGVEQMTKWLAKKTLTSKAVGMADEAAEAVLKNMAEKTASSAVRRYGKNLGLSLAEAAGRTGVMPSTFRNISEKATEIRTDEEGNNYLVGMNNAFASGLADSFIETLSEGGRVGALGELFGDVAGKIPFYKKMVDRLGNSKAGELWDMLQSSGVMNTLRAGGWHGIGEEYLEEWYGNALRTLTGVDKDALKEFATWDNQLVTVTSFLPLTIFGGTVSTAQVLSAQRGLDKKAAALRSALIDRGYDEAQADNYIDIMKGASPAEISSILSPIATTVAGRSEMDARALVKPFMDFAMAVRKWQSFDTKYKYQEQEQRDALQQQMEGTLGKFWQEDETGARRVQRAVNAQGETVYLLGKQSAADAEAGIPASVPAVAADGRKMFVNPSEYQLEDELDMNTFLGLEVMAEKGNTERARMLADQERSIQQIRQMSAPGTQINLGTAEAPVIATVAQRHPDGVIVTTPDGMARQLTYEELGNYLGINATPLTDAQLDEQEADALLAEQSQREAELDLEYGYDEDSAVEIAEAEEEIVQSAEAVTELPMDSQGNVDETALWNEDPARWAAWNDEQRQDGGANSVTAITAAMTNLSGQIAEQEAAYAAMPVGTERNDLEKQINANKARLSQLVSLQQGYAAQAEAALQAAAQEQAALSASQAQMTEQQMDEMDAQYEGIYSQTRSLNERARLLQEYLDKISVGTVPVVVLTKSNYAQAMKDAGCPDYLIRQVGNAFAKNGIIEGFMAAGKAFIVAESIPTIDRGRQKYVHERQHVLVRGTDYVSRILATGVTREQLKEYVRTFSGTRFYDNYGEDVLADELLSFAMELVYTYEDFSVALQKLGLSEDLINVIKSIDDEQSRTRNDERLSQARRRRRSNYNDGAASEGGSRQDDGDLGQVSSGLLGQQDDGSLGYSQRGAGDREGGEGAAEPAVDDEINPAFVDAISTDAEDAEWSQAMDDKAFATPPAVDGIEADDVRHSIALEGQMRESTQNYYDKHYKGGKLSKTDQKRVPLNLTHFTQELLDTANAMIEEMRQYMLPYLDMESKGKRFLPAEVYGQSTLFDNASYGKTMENTLICTRTLAYIDFVEEVKKRIGRPLTATESFLASQMLYDIAIDPQCLYCYVSLDRKAYDEFLLRYAQQRDEVIAKWNASDKSEEAKEAIYKEFLDGRKPTAQMKARFESWLLVAEGNDAITLEDLATKARRGQLRMADMPEAWAKASQKYKKLKKDKKLEYAASEEYQNALWGFLASPAGQVADAEAYAQSASWAKKEEDYRSYTGELLKCSADALKGLMGHYGLRFYSFSEYSPAFILENMQMVRDAAARGLKGFAYTKEIDFIRIFAPTGMNINCSVYGRVDSEGNVVPDTKQGADWAQVQELREQYPNVGAVFVATNDSMVEWALNQPWIDVIIPFHIVRTGADIAKFYEWTNYSSMQSDTTNEGKSGYVYPHEHLNDKETFLRITAERGWKPRFEDVKLSDGRSIVEHPNYMRLVNETRRRADETPILTPVFNLEAAKDSFDRFVEKGGYYSGYFVEDGAFEEGIETVVEDIKAGKTAKEVNYGRQDVPIDVAKIMAKRAELERKHRKNPDMLAYAQESLALHEAQQAAEGVRFSATEARELLDAMQAGAEILVPRMLTEEVWKNEIEGRFFTSPIGEVKFGENQYDKNVGKERAREFGMLIPTIERPDLIFEEYDPKEGAERQTKYVFVKTFLDEAGEKHINYASVSVRQEGMEVVTSSHRLRDKQALNKIEKEQMLWNRFASDSTSSAQGGSTDQSNALSDSKDSENLETPSESARFSVITPEMDADYLSAVERGDMETAQRMVDEAARAAGYDSPKLYHGTRNFGFTKLDTSKSDDSISFFATESPRIAQTYSGVEGERRINEAMREVDRKKLAEPYEEEANEYLLEHTRELAEWLNIEGRGIDIDEFATRVTDLIYGVEDWAIQENKSSLDVLIHTIKTYDTILEEYYDKEKYASVEEQLNADDGTWDARLQVAKAIGKYVDVMNGVGSFGNYSFYANTWAMEEIDCKGANWNNIKSSDLPRSSSPWTTRKVARLMKNEGWKGVILKNVVDLGNRANIPEVEWNSNIYIFFEPEKQVKSADPVTYDDAGNVIPLSERFNPENSDIRFSVIGEVGALRDKTLEGITRLENLDVARQMESQLNPDWSAKENEAALKIKVATGWERGADGLWRYEVEDVKIKPVKDWVNSKKKLMLGDVLEDNIILQLYPDLADITIIKGKGKQDWGAVYFPQDQEMKLPFGAVKYWQDAVDTYGEKYAGTLQECLDNMVSDIIHEVQHAIQHREGFAAGGSEDMVIDPEGKRLMDEQYNQTEELINEYNAMDYFERMSAYGVDLRRRAERAKLHYNDLFNKYRLGRIGYKKLGGEVEARNAEARQGWTEEQRRNSLLASTEDVARKDQTFIFEEVKKIEGALRFSAVQIDPAVRQEMDTIKAKAMWDGTFMKAPNGADTKLTEDQWLLVRTKNFTNWFGDWINDPENASKVVDENGEPMVMYHGTSNEPFTEFKREKIGTATDIGYSGKGFYFSSSKVNASSYLRYSGNDLMQVFLNIRNPYVVSMTDKDLNKEVTPFIGKQFFIGCKTIEEAREKYDGLLKEYLSIKDAEANINVKAIKSYLNEETIAELQQYDGTMFNWEGHPEFQETVATSPNQIKSATETTGEFSESGDIRFSAVAEAEEVEPRFSVVTDPALLDQLDNEEYITLYRAMQVVDGKLYPPMAGKVAFKEGEEASWGEPTPEQTWLQSDETPWNAVHARYDEDSKDGKHKKGDLKYDKNGDPVWVFKLDKGNGKTLYAAYNPYIHTSASPLNDQFSEAQSRDNLVVIRVLVPKSELTSGYKAEKAKDSVGMKPWHKGPISGVLAQYEGKGREVMLTRYAKIDGIVDFSEVADETMRLFEGTGLLDHPLPTNVFMPGLREELEKRGVQFVETTNKGEIKEGADKGKTWASIYGKDGLGKKPKEPKKSKKANNVRFSAISTPTDNVVAEGMKFSIQDFARLAGNIFQDMPESFRKEAIEETFKRGWDMQSAIFQIPARLAEKENWDEADKDLAKVIREKVQDAMDESGVVMSRPLTTKEALWMLYRSTEANGDSMLDAAKRSMVAYNLGFDKETLALEDEAREAVRFSAMRDATVNAKASMYNRGAVNVMTRLKESFVDMNASVEELVSAIEERSGKKAKGFENILIALNQQSSKGLAAMESYEMQFLNPMFDEIRKIMNETDFTYEDIVRYVILKHGLERNEKLAQRDAKAHYQEIYDEILSLVRSLDDAQKRTYLTNAHLKRQDALAKLAALKAMDTTSMTAEEKDEHKRNLAKAYKIVEEAEQHLFGAEKVANLSEAEVQKELEDIFKSIESGKNSVYQELRKNDYSGITSMFYDQLGVNRSDYATEEEYQAALMDAKRHKYDTLGDVEGAADMEVKLFEGAADTKGLWKRINAATKETLRQQYEANMISKEQYDNLRGMFEYYVPLRGFKDNTAEDMYTYYRRPNSTGYTKPILAAEGRKTEAESPFGWIASMAGSAIASNVKNEAKLALYYFVSNRPENGIATVSKTWYVHTPGDVDERGKRIFRPAYPTFSEDLSTEEAKDRLEQWQEQMRELKKQGLAYESGQKLNLGNAVVNISEANKPEHIVNVKVAGKDYTIIINGNPRAAQAINGDLNIEATAQDYSAVFGPILRWMSSVNTSYNPEFWITNMMRDMAFTWMAVNTKESPEYRRKFGENYRKAFSVIRMVAKNEKGTLGDSYLEKMYKEFVEYGGVTGYTQIKDNETWEKEIEKYLSSNDPESIRSGKVMKGVKNVFHAAHRFGESLEQVSRFAAFLTSREMGKPMAEAVNDAKEITVNFNRKGSGKMISLEEAKHLTGRNGKPLSKFWQWMAVAASSISPLGRRFIMFFNAAIQGLNATYKLFKANPNRMVGWTLAYAAVGAMNAVLHAFMDDDDDYLDMPQYERRNSLMIGGGGVYFKWALPQEARAFYALGDIAVESIMGRNPHQNVAEEVGKVFAELLPINPAEGWKALLPSIAVPAFELLLNEDYKGDPIYNEMKWLTKEERERTAKWSNAKKGTGKTYVLISKGLNNLTGGDMYDAGLINIQPEKMEHLVQSAFGGTIRTADKFITTVIAMIDPEEEWTARQTPFLNRILTINDERFRNVHVNDVFDFYRAEAEYAISLEKKYIKAKDSKALRELRGRDEYKWAKIYTRHRKALENINDKLREADGTQEKKELMKRQDELKKKMIKEFSSSR